MGTIGASKRYKVMENDGFKCKQCGIQKDLTIDHILPKSRGGGNELGNLQTLCFKCNTSKSNKIIMPIGDDTLKEKIVNKLSLVQKKDFERISTSLIDQVKEIKEELTAHNKNWLSQIDKNFQVNLNKKLQLFSEKDTQLESTVRYLQEKCKELEERDNKLLTIIHLLVKELEER